MNIDPTDDCTYWYSNQYEITELEVWKTSIASFRLPCCEATEDLIGPGHTRSVRSGLSSFQRGMGVS